MSGLPADPRRQWRLIVIVLVIVAVALYAAYYAFFRIPMTPAFQNICQADASAIVAELGKAGIPYRLANDGHDVMVPEDRASDARVAVAGANVPMGGTIGFELFNDSDMGLTEFAQKINFQRAMQGELARTIMAMQGVDFARVHLALPERSIFRASQGAPTSAVTVKMTPGTSLSPQRVDGIRQLIASSVPGLAPAAVAVLDESGDLVSPVATANGVIGTPVDATAALGAYYRLRAMDAIARAVPGLPVDVMVDVRQVAGAVPMDDARALPDRAGVKLTVMVRTATPLADDVRQRIDAVLGDTLLLQRDAGDTLRFAVGAVGLGDAIVPATAATEPRRYPGPISSSSSLPEPRVSLVPTTWPWLAGVAALVVFAVVMLRSRRRLNDRQVLSFADQLKAQATDRRPIDVG